MGGVGGMVANGGVDRGQVAGGKEVGKEGVAKVRGSKAVVAVNSCDATQIEPAVHTNRTGRRSVDNADCEEINRVDKWTCFI